MMTGKNTMDRPYKFKERVSRDTSRLYSLRQRQNISYNEAVLSCVNAVLDDGTELQERDPSHNTFTHDAREATLKNGSGATPMKNSSNPRNERGVVAHCVNMDQTVLSKKMEEKRTDSPAGTVLEKPLDLSTKPKKSSSETVDSLGLRDNRFNTSYKDTHLSLSRSHNTNLSAVDFQTDFHEKRQTSTSTSTSFQNVLHPMDDLSNSTTCNVFQTISCKEVKITNHYRTSFIDANASAGMGSSSTDTSDDEPDSSSSWDSASDTISDSDTVSDYQFDIDEDRNLLWTKKDIQEKDSKCWKKGPLKKPGRTIFTHLKSGQINRLMSICEVCGTGFCRKGDLNAHMNMAHHRPDQNYKASDYVLDRLHKKLGNAPPSMPQMRCENSVNALSHQFQQKCENLSTAVSTSTVPSMPQLECEAALDFIPDMPKPVPNIPRQKLCEEPQNPVQNCEEPKNDVPSMPRQKGETFPNPAPKMQQQKCETSQNGFPDVLKPKCEATASHAPNMPLPKCEASPQNHVPSIPQQKCNTLVKHEPLSKCEVSDNSTEPKCEGSEKLEPNLLQSKCVASDHSIKLNCEGSEKLEPNLPLPKCEVSDNSTEPKCEGSEKLEPNIPLPKCEVSDNSTEPKCEGCEKLEPNIPLPKCEVSDNSTVPKCEGSEKLEPNLPLPTYVSSDNAVYNKALLTRNTTQTLTVLSESNVHKWNLYNKDETTANSHHETTKILSNCSSDQSLRNGNVFLLSDRTSVTPKPFPRCEQALNKRNCIAAHNGSSKKLCTSHKENIGRLDNNGTVVDLNTLESARHKRCESKTVSDSNGGQGRGTVKTLYRSLHRERQPDKENVFDRQSINLQNWTDKSVTGMVSTSASFTGGSSSSRRASYETTSTFTRGSACSVSSINTSVSKYEDYMVLPGRQNVKLLHRLQKCPTCRKGFSRLSDLTSHSLTHDPNKQRSICLPKLEAKTSPVTAGRTNNKSKCGRGRPQKNYSQSFPTENSGIKKKVQVSGRGRKGGKYLRTAQVRKQDEFDGSIQCNENVVKKIGSRRGRPRTKSDSLVPQRPGKGRPSKRRMKSDSFIPQSTDNTRKCPICRRVFLTISCLQAHCRVHSGERPFKCKVCKKSFSQKGNLKIHTMIHTRERPYKCPTCKRSFNQLNLLLYHQWKTHDMEQRKGRR